jgi:hypothetical protein
MGHASTKQLVGLLFRLVPRCPGVVCSGVGRVVDELLGLHALAAQRKAVPRRGRIACPLMPGCPTRPAPIGGVAQQGPPQPKHRRPLPLQPPPALSTGHVEFQPDHRHRPGIQEVWCLRLPPPPRNGYSSDAVGGRGCHGVMQPQTTDSNPVPHRLRNPLPLSWLTVGQIQSVCPWPSSGYRRVQVGPGVCHWPSGCCRYRSTWERI